MIRCPDSPIGPSHQDPFISSDPNPPKAKDMLVTGTYHLMMVGEIDTSRGPSFFYSRQWARN